MMGNDQENSLCLVDVSWLSHDQVLKQLSTLRKLHISYKKTKVLSFSVKSMLLDNSYWGSIMKRTFNLSHQEQGGILATQGKQTAFEIKASPAESTLQIKLGNVSVIT